MYQRRLVGLLLVGVATALILTSVLTKTWWGSADPQREVSIGLRSAEVCEKTTRRSSSSGDGRSSYDMARPPDGDFRWEPESDNPRRRERSRTDCVDQGLRGYLEDEQDRADDLVLFDPDAPDPMAIPGVFIRLGAIAFTFGLMAAVGLLVAGAVVLFPSLPRHRSIGTVVAIVCGAFAATSLAYVVLSPQGFGGGVRAGPGVALALLGAVAGIAGALILPGPGAPADPSTRVLTEAARISTIGRAPTWIASGLGCALIAGSLFTQTWFHGEHGDASMGIGLRSVESCDRVPSSRDDDDDRGREKCVSSTVPAITTGSEQPTKMKVFLSSGSAAWLLGLGALGVALACAGLAALRQPIGGRYASWRLQLGVAAAFAVAAIVYVASRPAEITDVRISFGPVLAIGGAGCLIGGAIMLGRWVGSMAHSVTQVPAELAHESSQPIVVPGYAQPPHYAPGMMMMAPPSSPFAMPAPPPSSPSISAWAPPGAMPSSPFAPPTAPSAFVSPFAPPTAHVNTPPPPAASPFAPPPPTVAQPAPPPYVPPQPVATPPVIPTAPVIAPTFVQPMSFGAPAPAPQIPGCPQCTTPLLWVSAKNAWMCTVCRGRS